MKQKGYSVLQKYKEKKYRFRDVDHIYRGMVWRAQNETTVIVVTDVHFLYPECFIEFTILGDVFGFDGNYALNIDLFVDKLQQLRCKFVGDVTHELKPSLEKRRRQNRHALIQILSDSIERLIIEDDFRRCFIKRHLRRNQSEKEEDKKKEGMGEGKTSS